MFLINAAQPSLSQADLWKIGYFESILCLSMMGEAPVEACFFIEVVPHDGHSWRFILPPEGVIIGRSPNRCGLILRDRRISRIHLRATRSPERGIVISDLYSANGSTLDGHELPPGVGFAWLINQTVRAGSSCLTLRYGDPEIV